ncbi:MAG: fructosamine kinase family protein [Sulfuritalea sp.]|nr:fructosamine kinase family protein [Sulfuritalea sp.]
MNPRFDVIAAAISARTGVSFAALSVRPVSGGSIHSAWHLGDGRHDFFVKTNLLAAAPMFAAEARGLRALADAAVVPAPTVIMLGQTDSEAFLVLDHLALQPLEPSCGAALGRALAQLHRVRGAWFGWHEDNFIGSTPQRNAPHASWPHFFGDRRLRPQLQLALENGMEPTLIAKADGVIARIGGLFIDYHPVPSLLHGDLWSGNAAQGRDGQPVVFDPACYYGDRETDLAMAELFGGFPASFYAAYRTAWPLDSGYEARKPLYNLYHVLNHFNLFGDAYRGQVQRMIERLLADLRR